MSSKSNEPDDFNIEKINDRKDIEQNRLDKHRKQQFEKITKMIDDGIDIFVISEQLQLSFHEIDAILLGTE